MFRRTEKTHGKTPQLSPEKKPSQTPAEEQLALTEYCGTLVAKSCEAVNKELASAREKGLSIEEQEAYLKNLWAQRKIPRIAARGTAAHSTELRIINPEKVEFIKIRDLASYDDQHIQSASRTPIVEQDYKRYPFEVDSTDAPIVFAKGLNGYYDGVVNPNCMPVLSGPWIQKSLQELRDLGAQLEEASVCEEVRGQ